MNHRDDRVKDVPARFRQIPSKVRKSPWFGSTKKYLGACNEEIIPWSDYTTSTDNELGLGEHIQGVARIGRRLILSGGIKTGLKRSQLILIEMGTQNETGPWALPKYGFSYKKPSSKDRVVKAIDIDREKWHAGGIQAAGHVLAVPIYGGAPGSEIRYYDFSDTVTGPSELSNIRLVKEVMKAKAVALTRLPNGRYMTLIWDDEDLDFHFSDGNDILGGFKASGARVNKSEVEGGFQPGGGGTSGQGTYQSINLIVGMDDTVYFVGARNQEKASPTFIGKDFADLYKVVWPDGYESAPKISRIDHRQFYCYNQQCNFGAGVGIYVDDQEHLFLYGASHWLHGGNDRYNFNEYSYT
jgi:hypothetical protein